MARNRKRAKDRRARQPQGAPLTAAAGQAVGDAPPEPIEHATPDVELAEAQLAAGRPAVGPREDASADAEAAELEDERQNGSPSAEVAAPRASAPSRLATFAQGSWRELQRVQWPDRRQVMQATGVVIGFVIVAGAFLGVADLLAGKLVNYILTGHFK